MSLFRQSALILRRCIAQQVVKNESRSIKRWVAPTLKELYRRRQKVGEEPLKPRSTYLEWNYESELYSFGKRLGENFDRNLLKQALVQREYANMKEFNEKQKLEHNYDMIKEGGEIISNLIKKEYEKHYPNDMVVSVQNYLTTEEMLSHVGKHMGLTDLILTVEFPVDNYTLANTFKAVVSALKQSTDLNRAELFVKDFLICQMNGKDIYDIWSPEKPYSYLENLLKNKGINEVEPRLCNESASNTILANYQVGLYNQKTLLGIGWGESVEIAKDTAALDAIQRMYSGYIPK